MINSKRFDVIIIGGSYSGLSAGMALGRALRKVLIIDSGKPCNVQTPHSHNFITQDGQTPRQISINAKKQVEKYGTVAFFEGVATGGTKTDQGYQITTLSGDTFFARKLIFATGVKDIMPDIQGFAECWGISVLHCPYCHGYEVKNEKTGILGNGDYGFEFSKLISNWTKDLTLFTNGTSTLTKEQTEKLKSNSITIVETEIDRFEHSNGLIENIVFRDGSKTSLKAVYARPAFVQHCDLPEQLGCEITELGYVKVDAFQKTSVHGAFACGDNAHFMRSVANAVAMGSMAGAMVNREIIDEYF
jgi:thioredoxin reductase